ncbi:hypothetical protein QIF44_00060 [Stenotrophomonas indicatrix]|uniref:hypothetical protein n=1 Tax=Stenotrophomonas TaxID=40323 RepID=UPI00249AC80C|nr:hypothetical protein [Stenotrophomonas indicatrix]WGV54766.1 hypothetical protein QIF44_00060 [Stenotrophomonas indicatrix]
MSAPVRDPLQIPPDLQARVEAVPGLRAFYRRASLLRVFGLACLPLAATALSCMALAFTGTELGPPSWAQVPAGYGSKDTGRQLLILLVMTPLLLVWMFFGVRDLLSRHRLRRFAWSFALGSMLLCGAWGSMGITAPAIGQGDRLDYRQLDALIASPDFSGFSPQWQAYLRAQQELPYGVASSAVVATARALANGEDIGVPVSPAMQSRFEKAAGLPRSERSQRLHQQRLLGWLLFDVGWVLALLAVPALLALGAVAIVLGHHLRRRSEVINGLLQQLQPVPAPPRAQP